MQFFGQAEKYQFKWLVIPLTCVIVHVLSTGASRTEIHSDSKFPFNRFEVNAVLWSVFIWSGGPQEIFIEQSKIDSQTEVEDQFFRNSDVMKCVDSSKICIIAKLSMYMISTTMAWLNLSGSVLTLSLKLLGFQAVSAHIVHFVTKSFKIWRTLSSSSMP